MTRNRFRRILDDAGETTTLIGAGTSFRGDFTGKGSFIVGGNVIGDCDIDGTVTLAVGGSWEGHLRARDVVVSGSIQGEVTARGKLEIGATAHVEGTVTGAEIAIAQGAVVTGGVHVTGAAQVTRFTEKRAPSSDRNDDYDE
jgi:cytoskeletal protein CcmA (bactofilin family)